MMPSSIIVSVANHMITPGPGSGRIAGDFQWMPRTRMLRVILWLAGTGALGLTFAAYLRPNMVFDLANLIFCG